MYFFEQLLYEAAPPASLPQPPTPKPVTYAAPGTKEKVAKQQALQAQAQAEADQQAQAHQQLQMQEKQADVTQKQAQASQLQAQSPPPPEEDEFAGIDFSGDDMGGEEGEGDISQDPTTTLIPIKRYYLIQKLFALNDKLNQLRIKNDVLSLVILFIDSFSYESLLSLSNKLVEDIYLQVKETSKEAT